MYVKIKKIKKAGSRLLDVFFINAKIFSFRRLLLLFSSFKREIEIAYLILNQGKGGSEGSLATTAL